MILVFFYSVATMPPLEFSGIPFPSEYIAAGWIIFAIGLIQLPIWFIYAFSHNSKKASVWEALRESLKPNENWGPVNPQKRIEWMKFKEEGKQRHRLAARNANHSGLKRKLYTWFGKY